VGFVRGCDGVGKSRQEGRQAVGMQSSIVETPLASCCVIFLSETMQLCMSTVCSKRHIGIFVPRYRLLFGISPFCFSRSGKKQKGRTRGIYVHGKRTFHRKLNQSSIGEFGRTHRSGSSPVKFDFAMELSLF